MWEEELRALIAALRDSEEYQAYREAQAAVEENPSTVALLREYHKAQMRVQTLVLQDLTEGPDFDRFRSLSDALQTDPEATGFLLAEYRLKKGMGDIFKALTHAVELDLGFLE